MDRWRAGPLAALLALLLLAPNLPRAGQPGDFAFYVLSLSWSPTFCAGPAAESERLQCETLRPRGFVVHGLWPQYEAGFPEFCPSEQPRVPRSLTATLLDIMPSPGLVAHQWRKHGTCSGLDAAAYFAKVRRAREAVAVPERFREPEARQFASAREVEQAFVAANPGLSERGMAVVCRDRHLTEVRICLSRELQFRRCAEIDRRGCRERRLTIPADGRSA